MCRGFEVKEKEKKKMKEKDTERVDGVDGGVAREVEGPAAAHW